MIRQKYSKDHMSRTDNMGEGDEQANIECGRCDDAPASAPDEPARDAFREPRSVSQ